MEYLLAFLTAVYFILGFGVSKLWEKSTEDNQSIVVLLLWPLILMVSCVRKFD